MRLHYWLMLIVSIYFCALSAYVARTVTRDCDHDHGDYALYAHCLRDDVIHNLGDPL